MPSYPGGKSGSGVYHRLAMELPPHDERIIPFLGRCAILRHVRPAGLNVGIESDAGVLAQWSAQDLAEIRESAPPSTPARVELHHGCGVQWLKWRFGLSRWPAESIDPLSPPDVLAAVYGGSRGHGQHRAAGDGGVGRPVPFIFADPPYPLATCTSGSPYAHSFSDEQHAELLGALVRLPALVMVVSYPNALYAEALSEWRTFKYRAFTRRGERTEQAWCNYPRPRVLHDWRFAGKNRRERERIARRVRNWRRMFRHLPPPERAAILSELVEAQHGEGSGESIFAGVCSRCLTVNPPSVEKCPVCNGTPSRRVHASAFAGV